jgi:hypothetical protein
VTKSLIPENQFCTFYTTSVRKRLTDLYSIRSNVTGTIIIATISVLSFHWPSLARFKICMWSLVPYWFTTILLAIVSMDCFTDERFPMFWTAIQIISPAGSALERVPIKEKIGTTISLPNQLLHEEGTTSGTSTVLLSELHKTLYESKQNRILVYYWRTNWFWQYIGRIEVHVYMMSSRVF